MRCHLVLSLWLGLCFWTTGLSPTPVEASVLPSATVMVPMRDGTLLATDVYLPAGNGPWPVVLARTPFGRGYFAPDDALFNPKDIALVSQDTRGTGASQGVSLGLLGEGWSGHPDGPDTVRWIRSQPWSNGKIATYGSGVPEYLLAGTGPEGIVGHEGV